jgi:hypothetical protein
VRDRSCLYAKSIISKPHDTVATLKQANSTSFMLQGGVFINIVVWDCNRLGRRILIVVPESKDTVKYVQHLVTQNVDVGSKIFAQVLRESFDKQEFESSVQVKGLETAEFSVTRNTYESTYIIEYYTAD